MVDYANDRNFSTQTNMIEPHEFDRNKVPSHLTMQTVDLGEERYKFKFSTLEEVQGKPSKCRIFTIILLIIATIFLPAAIAIDRVDNQVDWDFPWNSWLVYVIVVDTTILMVGGAYIVSTVAYPYSNSILVKNLSVTNNKRFGIEFARQIDRMVRMIRDMMETQGSENSSNIMEGREDASGFKTTQFGFMTDQDIYMRVAANLELIDLYETVNRKIIRELPGQSQLFLQTTDCLTEIRRILREMEI